MSETTNERYLTTRDLATRYRLSEVAITEWRYRGEGPPYVRLGRSIRYSIEAVEAWERERTIGGGDAS